MGERCETYVFEAGVVVLANVVELIDEDVVLAAEEVIAFPHSFSA